MVGFAGWSKGDIPYEVVLEEIEREIKLELTSEGIQLPDETPIQKSLSLFKTPLLFVRKRSVSIQLKSEVVLSSIYKGTPWEVISSETDLSFQTIRDILYEFEVTEKVTRRVRKSFNMKRWKIREEHVQCLQDFIINTHHLGFKLKDAKRDLLSKFPDLNNISLTTSSHYLKTISKWAITNWELWILSILIEGNHQTLGHDSR